MACRFWMSVVALLFAVGAAHGQASDLKLASSFELKESGVLNYILPRFSLKTGIRFGLVTLEQEGEMPSGADLVMTRVKPSGAEGRLFMQGLGARYYIAAHDLNDKKSKRFLDWLASEVGQNTIEAFAPDGVQIFTANAVLQDVAAKVVFDGDTTAGKALAYRNCGRCHVVGDANRMKGIGSTPSFALLRTFADWQTRFQIYFTLNPHPPFSQITGITEPFDPAYPPSIVPLALTEKELDAILAFVATIEPADLGAPLQHQ